MSVACAGRLCVDLAFELVGIKPSSLAIANMAVLTNQICLCPSVRILVSVGWHMHQTFIQCSFRKPVDMQAELTDVTSIDEASKKCDNTPTCSHYSLDLVGSRSTPMDKQRLVLWHDNP